MDVFASEFVIVHLFFIELVVADVNEVRVLIIHYLEKIVVGHVTHRLFHQLRLAAFSWLWLPLLHIEYFVIINIGLKFILFLNTILFI